MGIERRQQPRFRCSIPCELRIGGSSLAGKVRDVSFGGLGVVAEAPAADQGDEVGVTLRVAGHAPIAIRALVWHVRTMRRGAGDKPARNFGLVLSDSAPEFAQLVERIGAKRPAPRVAAAPPPQPAVEPQAPDPPVPPQATAASPAPTRTREYRIRVKQSSGSRTCRVVASGVTPEAAAEVARSEVGPGWVVLEIAPVA